MFTSINPATGAPGESFAELTKDEIAAKVAQADATYRQWRLTDPAERAALLERIAEQFDANTHRLAEIATREMGKTLKSAIAEVQKCAAAFRHYAQEGPAMLEPRSFPGATATWHPMGPVLAVMPWNFPYWQVVRFMAPTIMAGNVGLLKHASNVQGCGAALEEMVIAAGGPAGLFQNLAIKSAKVADL
ncbi:MAG: aldehyde dehydrogenase family protein, partial [Sphingomonas sp.]